MNYELLLALKQTAFLKYDNFDCSLRVDYDKCNLIDGYCRVVIAEYHK